MSQYAHITSISLIWCFCNSYHGPPNFWNESNGPPPPPLCIVNKTKLRANIANYYHVVY